MSINKIVGLSSLVLVIGAAGSGLYLSGPPGEQRLVRQDQQRVSDLINISGYISNYRHRHKTMPESTAVILDGRVARSIWLICLAKLFLPEFISPRTSPWPKQTHLSP